MKKYRNHNSKSSGGSTYSVSHSGRKSGGMRDSDYPSIGKGERYDPPSPSKKSRG